VKAGPHFTCSARSAREISEGPPYALYLRIRPWTTRDFDIQVGACRRPSAPFARRTYANDNPLIGYPLAYQYLTTLRPDALPASADELLRKRSLGWLVRYSVGDRPPIAACRWSARSAGTPAFRRTRRRHAERDASVTAGTVSNPLFSDDNHGRQWRARRVAARDGAGRRHVAGARSVRQPGGGAAALGDAEDARVHADGVGRRRRVLARSLPAPLETIVSRWRIPVVAAPACSSPAARSARVDVGSKAATSCGRTCTSRRAYDHLGFSDETSATRRCPGMRR
jgi:hypothetical protein